MTIERSEGSLSSLVGGTTVQGRLFASGVFELSSLDAPETFTLKGQHLPRSKPEELRGEVTYRTAGSLGCQSQWQFIANRE